MTPEQQKAVAIAKAKAVAMKRQGGGQSMRHVNRGIVDAIGGAVDFINPFDEPHALNPFSEGISAKRGLEAGAGRAGIELGGEAETAWQSAQQGMGEAAASLIPIAKGLQALRSVGGTVGQFADDAYRSLASVLGSGAEVAAGAASRGAEKGAENAGAPEWAQQAASVAAPMGLAGVRPTLDLASRITPGGQAVRRVTNTVKTNLAPYTESGANEVASQRAVALAGGEDRARRLVEGADARRAEGDYGLSPAQMLDDDAFRGVEQLAIEQDPNIGDTLAARRAAGQARAEADVRGMGGEVENATRFYQERLKAHTARLQAAADDVTKRANRGLEIINPQRTESQNSIGLMDEIGLALDDAVTEEKRLWGAIPMSVSIDPAASQSTAKRILDETPWAQSDDVPRVVRQLLDVEGPQTVRELHGLYSELRRVARTAMAGNDVNKNRARIANDVAEAVLADLGAQAGDTPWGKAINDARAYSRALHETFDQGAPGRLRKKTLDGDLSTEPELALQRTVGRGGAEGMKSAERFQSATKGRADPYVTDYIKGRFAGAAIKPTGEFNRSGARKFVRDNKDLLDKYPELRGDITDAVEAKESADAFASRITRRIGEIENAKTDARAAWLNGRKGEELKSIFTAKNPPQAARRLAQEARKDPDGKALAGLKGAVVDHLIAGGAGDLPAILSDNKKMAAIRQILSPDELGRLKVIARHIEIGNKTSAANVGETLSGAKPAMLIRTLARVAGAKGGAAVAGGGNAGTSLQAAGLGASNAQKILDRLVSDKASQILADATTDFELMRSLLIDPASPRFEKEAIPRLIPYLIGAGVTSTDVSETPGPRPASRGSRDRANR